MPRIIIAILILLAPTLTRAADGESAPAGTWKLSIYQEGQLHTLWIVELKSMDGQWSGAIVATPKEISKGKIESLQLAGDVLRFNLKIEDRILAFEGKVSKQ